MAQNSTDPLWKFKDNLGYETYIRPEDFKSLCVEVDNNNENPEWRVYITAEDSFSICDEDAERMRNFLDKFLVVDFSKDASPEVVVHGTVWKAN